MSVKPLSALAPSCIPSTTSDLGGSPAFSQAQFEVVFNCHEEVLEGHSCPVEKALQEKLLWKQGMLLVVAAGQASPLGGQEGAQPLSFTRYLVSSSIILSAKEP